MIDVSRTSVASHEKDEKAERKDKRQRKCQVNFNGWISCRSHKNHRLKYIVLNPDASHNSAVSTLNNENSSSTFDVCSTLTLHNVLVCIRWPCPQSPFPMWLLARSHLCLRQRHFDIPVRVEDGILFPVIRVALVRCKQSADIVNVDVVRLERNMKLLNKVVYTASCQDLIFIKRHAVSLTRRQSNIRCRYRPTTTAMDGQIEWLWLS